MEINEMGMMDSNSNLGDSGDTETQMSESNSEAIAQTSQQPSENVQEQENWDFTKDSRWQKMWKDPKDIYKSYRNLEQAYEPIKGIKSEYDNMQKIFSENGIEANKLNDYISEYKQLVNPKNPRNMIADYFGEQLNNAELRPLIENFFSFAEKPEYLPHLNNFLNELQTTENQRLYPGWDSQRISEHKAMQQELSNFKKMFEEQKQKETEASKNKEIDNQIQKVESFAKENGIPVDTNTFSQIGKYLQENGLNEKHIMLAFKELYSQQLEELRTKRLEESLLKKLNKNNSKVVPNATTKIQNESTANLKTDDKIKYYLNKIRGVS